ncbi:hypothetical protein DR62_07145 [Burkholderia thailandensis]|nr:hypothetical protein DR62_07145 [Burkholderia thailandensis]AOI54334.1 hypothetical protein WI24_20985 [Burkholderia thailandensis]AOJ53316.1 hypothetical protein AQ475_20790 [Burkholderia thailandensis]
MTNPLLELPRLFRPRRDRAGKQAGTTDDDQIFVIVFVMMMVMILPTTMARAPPRAGLPWSFETGEIREVAIVRVYTNPSGRTTAEKAGRTPFPGRHAAFFHIAFGSSCHDEPRRARGPRCRLAALTAPRPPRRPSPPCRPAGSPASRCRPCGSPARAPF